MTEPTIEERAREVAALAHMAAIGLLPALLEQSTTLRSRVAESGTDSWDFFASVAMTYFALHLIGRGLTSDEYERICRIAFDPPPREPSLVSYGAAVGAVEKFDIDWRTLGPRALADCTIFVERLTDGVDDVAEGSRTALVGVGSWVLWNVYGAKPGSGDDRLLAILGPGLARAAATFW